jgi:hypothetical protein
VNYLANGGIDQRNGFVRLSVDREFTPSTRVGLEASRWADPNYASNKVGVVYERQLEAGPTLTIRAGAAFDNANDGGYVGVGIAVPFPRLRS